MRLEGERGNGAVKGRKLPGEVLQCFQNLSSHSAELSGMNNRFGTWPACTGEAVTAALRAGLPTFDGCAVSQNSWRRGALAACMRWRKKANKQKARAEISLWGRHTHPGSAGARQVTLQHGLRGLTHTMRNSSYRPTAPSHSQMRAMEKVHPTQCHLPGGVLPLVGLSSGSEPPAAPEGDSPAGAHLPGALQAGHATAAPPAHRWF